jgi:hypothetical protein
MTDRSLKPKHIEALVKRWFAQDFVDRHHQKTAWPRSAGGRTRLTNRTMFFDINYPE